MHLGFSTHYYVYESLDTSHIDEIKLLGYDKIELWGMPPNLDTSDKERIKKLKLYLKKTGIKAGSFHGPLYRKISDPPAKEWLYLSSSDEQKRKEAVSRNLEIISLMSEFNSTILVIHFDLEEGTAIPVAFDNFRKSIDELLCKSSQKGIRIAIENTNEHTTSGKLVDFIKNYHSQDVGICLDLGHTNMFENPCDAIKICGERLIHTHLSDNDGKGDLHLVPGKGNIDWEKVTKTASETGYKGLLMLEIRKEAGLNKPYADIIKEILGI